MKQQITAEQLNELTEEQKKKLRYWCINHHVVVTPIPEVSDFAPTTYDIQYLPNIGEMIEFLDEQNPLGKGFGTVKGTNGLTYYWNVTQYDKSYNKPELCDALWEAVKECL